MSSRPVANTGGIGLKPLAQSFPNHGWAGPTKRTNAPLARPCRDLALAPQMRAAAPVRARRCPHVGLNQRASGLTVDDNPL